MKIFCLVLIALSLTFYCQCYINVCTPTLAKIAYYQSSLIQAFKCQECQWFKAKCIGSDGQIKSIQVFNNTEQKLLFYSLVKKNTRLNTNFVYIVVRGTVPTQVQNWITNLDFSKTDYPDKRCKNCQVHQGFYQAFLHLKNQMIGQVDKAIQNLLGNINVSIVGHSLGGAIATFAAIQIKTVWPKYFVELVTYGQPRVGEQNFASFINSVVSRTQRNIHYADIVPHAPPLIFGFKHYNMEYWYNENMTFYKICLAQNPSCSDSIPDYDFSFSDHSMDNYKLITKNAQFNLSCSMATAEYTYPKNTSNIILPVSITVHYEGFQISQKITVYQEVVGLNNCSIYYYADVIQQDDLIFGTDHYCNFGNGSSPSITKYNLIGQVYAGETTVKCSGSYTIYINDDSQESIAQK